MKKALSGLEPSSAREQDIFPDGQLRHQAAVLKDKAHPPAAKDRQLLLPQRPQVHAVHGDGSLCRLVQSADQIQKRGLSAAGGPDDGGELSFFDGEVNPVHGLYLQGTRAKVFF